MATPRSAVAKFAAGGKAIPRKDLGIIASAYGNVYVAQVALGANETQTVRALLEADAWRGPSLVIAYSTCIAHGIDMSTSMTHQKAAVSSGYWELYRYSPTEAEHGQRRHEETGNDIERLRVHRQSRPFGNESEDEAKGDHHDQRSGRDEQFGRIP